MTTIEFISLRIFTEFVWKRIPPIDHEFTVKFLNIFNILFGISMSILLLMFGDGEEIERLQGFPSFLDKDPVFKPR